MINRFKPILIFSILFSLYITSTSQSCKTYSFSGNQVFSSCNDLPNLNSYIHWNYDQTAETLNIAYRHTNVPENSWVAWAINPTGEGMIGSQALVALHQSDGTMRAYTSPVMSYSTQLKEGNLSFPVSNLTATYERNEVTIFATLKIDNPSSILNQVWQDGPVSGNSPGMHSLRGDHAQSMGTINFFSEHTQTAPTVSGGASSPIGSTSPTGASCPTGASSTTGSSCPFKNLHKRFMAKKAQAKNIHGLLNVVSWGILLPIGVVSARYMKVFPSADPAWFYIHVICQTSAYIVGVAGWATGIQLGSKSPGICHTAHKVIGTVLFALATLQVCALFLRPNKQHKLRIYWNIYHHFIGYIIIVLSIINIFKGFVILNNPTWKRVYVGILIGLAVFAAVLEAYTWFVVLKRKKTSNSDDGTNGYNGHGEMAQDNNV